MDADQAQRIAFEADYWQAVLTDLGAVHEMIMQAADANAEQTVALISLLGLSLDARFVSFVGEGMEHNSRLMKLLGEMQTALMGALEVIQGRADVLTKEAAA